jgi:hypothetical protein
MKTLPIIFFHYGNPSYLKYSLKQAKYFNPGSTIYLIGDKKNGRYPFVTHILASNFEAETNALTNIYKHRSTNDAKYELNCFLRWIYIKAFCKAKDIEAFIYLDSDVLVFQDFSKIAPLLNKCQIANTCSWTGMPAFTYFNNYKAISDFGDYLIYSYSDKTAIAKMENWYRSYSDSGLMGGVSDMILFHQYFQGHPNETLKVDLVNNQFAIDVSINNADGYETEGGVKKIYWKNNLPYCKNLTSGQLVRFATLHYQGNSKKLMIDHYKAGGYFIQIFLERIEIKKKFKTFRRSIKKLFR